jgi:nitrogenase molybdenum-iron protein NifN
MNKAADILGELTEVPDYRFDHLMGLDAIDNFVDALQKISGEAVPEKLERQRAQLQDAMLDTHFMLGLSKIAIAGDPDLLNSFSQMLAGVGADTVAAVSPVNAPVLKSLPTEQVQIGDLEDLEKIASQNGAELLIANSHGVESADRLGIPLLRAGFPQYDTLGGYQKTWVGYRGTRQTLFDLANIMLTLEKGEIHPYHSIYAQKTDQTGETDHDSSEATAIG